VRSRFEMSKVLVPFCCALVVALCACDGPMCIDRLTQPELASAEPFTNVPDGAAIRIEGDGVPSGRIQVDLDGLESAGTVGFAVNDPWRQEQVYYSGVLLRDVLAHCVDCDSVSQLVVVGLDGYSAEIDAEVLEKWPVLLATRCDGARMSVACGGPTRIILPYERYPNLADARTISVWNIESVRIQ